MSVDRELVIRKLGRETSFVVLLDVVGYEWCSMVDR